MKTEHSSKKWAIIWIVAALVVMAILGWQVVESRHSNLFNKETWKAPDYSFQDRSGRMFSTAELKGKVYVVDFIFGHCAGSCPLLSRQMQLIQQEWKDNPDLKLVSMSVDPEHDTAAFLKGYAEDYHADVNQWFFLTGKKEDLYKVIREGYKAAALEAPEQGPGFDFIHSTHLILVDGRGMIRGVYDGEQDEEVQKLHKDIKFLMGSRSRS